MKIFTESEIFIEGSDNIRVSRKVNLKKEEPLHKHEFIEMTYYLDGGAIHTINGQQFKVEKGDLLMLGPHHEHSHVPVDFVSYIHIFVKTEFMRSYILDADHTMELFFLSSLFGELGEPEMASPVIKFRGSEMLQIKRLYAEMSSEYLAKPPAYETVLECSLKLILTKIFRKIRVAEDKKWIREIGKMTPNIIEYINNNYSEKVTVSEFAKKSFYTPSYFSRLFKASHGKSIKEYITEKRMQDVITLLCTTDLPIDKIAADIGYSNKNQFYKIFKKYTGQTPAQFRKSQK